MLLLAQSADAGRDQPPHCSECLKHIIPDIILLDARHDIAGTFCGTMLKSFSCGHSGAVLLCGQVVDPGQQGPVRCSECKAYMNPHMIWRDAGRSFICTFCGSTTQTPHDYIEHIGPDGRRRDADQRPELSCGSYELVAGPQFQVRAPDADAEAISSLVPSWCV